VRASLEATAEEAYRPRILERHEIITFGETKEPRVRSLDFVRGVQQTVLEITHEPIISRTCRMLTHRFDMTHRSDDADGFIKLSTLVLDGRYRVADTVQHHIRELAKEVRDEPVAL
jgi:hypothetical protein